MAKKKRRELGANECRCNGCGKIYTKSLRCIAQRAMGNTMYRTCSCGYKIVLIGEEI